MSWFLCALALLLGIRTSEALLIQVYNNSVLIKTFEDKNAVVHSKSYGIPYYDNIEGSLVYANPRNACRPVENFKLTNLIAFVPDYDDCIAVNAENLHDAGFQMMITYSMGNNKLDLSVSEIPQAIVDQTFSQYLIDNVVFIGNDTSNDNIQISVSEDYLAFYEKLLIIFGIVLLGAIVLAILMFFCTCCCRWSVNKWRNRGLTAWRIRQLPRRRYRKAKETTDTCSICLEEFEEREYVRVLPCDHIFHPSCVDEWLKNWNRVCPLCKASISHSHRQREQEPLLTDLESGESSNYGSIRLSDGAAPEVVVSDDGEEGSVNEPSNRRITESL